MGYSVAIRTLGLNLDLLRKELQSIYEQSIIPDKVVIYIAQGYPIPNFRIGNEIYVPVQKGMVAQRALYYKEVESKYILLLDDDMYLNNDSVKSLLDALIDKNLDAISPDIYYNHKMPIKSKIYAAFTGLVFPHYSRKYAYKIHRDGAFSYMRSPRTNVCLSQSASGGCSLWKLDKLRELSFVDELWLDSMGFAFKEDQLEFYKLYINGGRLGVHFNSGVIHLGGKTSSGDYIIDPLRFYKRAKTQYIVWHRTLMSWRNNIFDKFYTTLMFGINILLTFPAICAAALQMRNLKVPYLHLKGTIDGIRYTKSAEYRSLPPYKFK